MGYQDREYYRDESARGSFLGGADQLSVTTKLVIVTVGVFFADMLFGSERRIMETLALHASDLTKPLNWWHYLSYAFAHNRHDARHILFNMLGLFMLGREVEWSLRSRQEYLKFYLCSAIFSGVVWALLHFSLLPGDSVIGASGAVSAVVILFVWQSPNRKMLVWFVEMPAWAVGILFVLMDVFGSFHHPDERRVAYDAHLAGAVFATLYFFAGQNLSRFIPDWPFKRGVGPTWAAWKRRLRPRPKLKAYVPDTNQELLDAEADRILEKVHREGESSLSKKEREALEAYSRRMRERKRP